jgi:hypothetical protein
MTTSQAITTVSQAITTVVSLDKPYDIRQLFPSDNLPTSAMIIVIPQYELQWANNSNPQSLFNYRGKWAWKISETLSDKELVQQAIIAQSKYS